MFENIAVNGVSALALIIGLTEALKEFGVVGKWSRLAALALGVGYALLHAIFYTGATAPDAIFSAVVIGFVLGLAATGLYDVTGGFGGTTVITALFDDGTIEEAEA